MPVTKSAHKKMRGDTKKTVVNLRRRRTLREFVKSAQESKTAEAVRNAISQIDKAVKNHLMHANKAGRMKSQLMKQVGQEATKKSVAKKTVKKPAKKSSVKKSVSKKK